MGPAKAAVLLIAARECGTRYLRERLRPGVPPLALPADSRQFLLASPARPAA